MAGTGQAYGEAFRLSFGFVILTDQISGSFSGSFSDGSSGES